MYSTAVKEVTKEQPHWRLQAKPREWKKVQLDERVMEGGACSKESLAAAANDPTGERYLNSRKTMAFVIDFRSPILLRSILACASFSD